MQSGEKKGTESSYKTMERREKPTEEKNLENRSGANLRTYAHPRVSHNKEKTTNTTPHEGDYDRGKNRIRP